MFKVLVPLFPKVGWIVEVETSQNLLVSLSGLINFLVIINEVFQLLVNVTQLFTKLPLDLAKPKSRARIFFSRTSQGHNALPRPGLGPGSSDSEPSALTTRLLDKAVALVCPRYSWPRMLKVAPCTVVRSYIQIFSAWWVTTILYNYGAMWALLWAKFFSSYFPIFVSKICLASW